ncbi:GvpL/GvpF family gas vesicle protein [Calderihabitans maritimus]|uniref:Gas vesicle synthesis GvpLGvpF n=1 Tax=Calderihabitans maritimus TaxID=1246530 RepID=A0A1Z5HWR2_9FIRM|nr:GvpL/GvpF family gas vesicle protein [Calderihabitans maritimus]GAW93973.1 hypothetical protein KKC1_30930 [Calderihabitans maritimus]
MLQGNDAIQQPAQEAVYLYCITGESTGEYPAGLGTRGVDPANPVYSIPYRNLRAVVSKVPLDEFGEEALRTRLEDMDWIRTKGMLHERVIRQVMSKCTVIPMRFATIYRDDRRIREILAENYSNFSGILLWLEGKEEWGVKIYYRLQAMEEHVIRFSPQVGDLKQKIAVASGGQAYLLKKKLSKTVQEEIDRLLFAHAEQCYGRLKKLAVSSCTNDLLDKKVTGKDVDMILNAAYLVEQQKINEFLSEVIRLQKDYPYLEFDYSGPWPAYNFCTVSGKGSDEHARAK